MVVPALCNQTAYDQCIAGNTPRIPPGFREVYCLTQYGCILNGDICVGEGASRHCEFSGEFTCGGIPCPVGHPCCYETCCSPGDFCCGESCCAPTDQCCPSGTCCPNTEQCCGANCCPTGTNCCNGTCVPTNSPNNCGGNCNVCQSGQDCCNGGCVPTDSPENCGGNCNTCTQGSSCCGGKCCSQGETCFSGCCVDGVPSLSSSKASLNLNSTNYWLSNDNCEPIGDLIVTLYTEGPGYLGDPQK
jgi:hypothetical protein